LTYARSDMALTIGAIFSNVESASAQTCRRWTSPGSNPPGLKRITPGQSAPFLITAKQSSIISERLRWANFACDFVSQIAITTANANSCADNSRMPILPAYASSNARFLVSFNTEIVAKIRIWFAKVYRELAIDHDHFANPIFAGLLPRLGPAIARSGYTPRAGARTPSSPSRSSELTHLRPAADVLRAGRVSRLHHKGQRQASPRPRVISADLLRTFQVAAGQLQAFRVRPLHRCALRGRRPDEVING